MSDSDECKPSNDRRRSFREVPVTASVDDVEENQSSSSRSPSPALPSRLDRIPSPSNYKIAHPNDDKIRKIECEGHKFGMKKLTKNDKKRSRSRSVEKKLESISPKREKRRSNSISPVRKKRPRSESPRNKSPRNRSPRNRNPRNRSPRNRSPRNRSPRNRSPRNNSPRNNRRSRSPNRKRRSQSRSRDYRRRQSRSSSRDRWRRTRSHSRDHRRRSSSKSRDRRRSRSRSHDRRRHRNGGHGRRSYSRSPSPHFTSKWGMKRTHGLTRAVLPANPSDKKPKELSTQEVEEKLALHMKSVRENAAEEAKRINLPGYLNPAMVNVHQFKQVQDKRKLLWSKTKDKKEGATQWAGAFEDQNNDEKFKRLMGIQGVEVNGDCTQVSQSKRVLDDLEKEYEKSRAFQMSRGAGGLTGVGLGFGSMCNQP